MVKTVIFDIGGVLVNLDYDQVCAGLEEYSNVSAGDLRREVNNGPIVTRAMLGHLDAHEYHEALCDKLALSLSYDEFVPIWNSLLSANEAIVPLVEKLKPVHNLVIASNTDPIHFAHTIKQFHVLSNFDQLFLSHEMGLLKPDPEFFHYILKSLNAPASECIFIDDRAENVGAALSVGITSLRFISVGQLEEDLSTVL